ncbi:MAG: hypothetical protein ACTSR8_22140 [Promethearchaeota archaeon]
MYFIDDHLDLATMMTIGRKVMGYRLMESYGPIIPVSLGKLLGLQISSKLHGGNFLSAK